MLNSFCMSPPPRQTSHKHHTNKKELETSVLWDCFLMDLGNQNRPFRESTLEVANKKDKTCVGEGLCHPVPRQSSIRQCHSSVLSSEQWKKRHQMGVHLPRAVMTHRRWWTKNLLHWIPKMMDKHIKKRGKSITKIYWYYVAVCGRTWQPGKKKR